MLNNAATMLLLLSQLKYGGRRILNSFVTFEFQCHLVARTFQNVLWARVLHPQMTKGPVIL